MSVDISEDKCGVVGLACLRAQTPEKKTGLFRELSGGIVFKGSRPRYLACRVASGVEFQVLRAECGGWLCGVWFLDTRRRCCRCRVPGGLEVSWHLGCPPPP